ncbi:VOC family protein [Magnetovibrio sp. PR-2]|uniref:VOC family protein n=1 Tax=Magnetovibrio sp. PR-2 TaxID=3120356 RepID=UPI002FCE2C1E
MSNRVHLITLGVSDMARSRAFYEALGWERAPYDLDEVSFYQAGAQVLGLYLQDMLDADTGLSGAKPGGITLAINQTCREDVNEMLAKLVNAGGSILAEPKDMPWGYVAYGADPDGHPWEFSYVPTLIPNADGAVILPESLDA